MERVDIVAIESCDEFCDCWKLTKRIEGQTPWDTFVRVGQENGVKVQYIDFEDSIIEIRLGKSNGKRVNVQVTVKANDQLINVIKDKVASHLLHLFEENGYSSHINSRHSDYIKDELVSIEAVPNPKYTNKEQDVHKSTTSDLA